MCFSVIVESGKAKDKDDNKNKKDKSKKDKDKEDDLSKEFIENVILKTEISESSIKEIKDINLGNPPKGVVLGEIYDSDLNIYEVKMKEKGRSVFVISLC